MRKLIGRTFTIIIDRPLGSTHPNYPNIIYPINYGYIPNSLAGDNMEQDVYLLGIDTPVETFTGVVIAILKRSDDVENKLVMTPAGVDFSNEEILVRTYFQEQYFQTTVHRQNICSI